MVANGPLSRRLQNPDRPLLADRLNCPTVGKHLFSDWVIRSRSNCDGRLFGLRRPDLYQAFQGQEHPFGPVLGGRRP